MRTHKPIFLLSACNKALRHALTLYLSTTIAVAFVGTAAAKGQAELTDRHAYELRIINRLIDRFHYQDYDLNDTLSIKILDRYIEQLDPNHWFFVQNDITEFYKLKHDFDDYVKAGITDPAYAIYEIYQTRVQERIDFALGRLSQSFNFELAESFATDRKEQPWALSEKALNDVWRKRIKNEYLGQLLNGKKEAEILTTLSERYNNILKRTTEIKSNELFQLIANAYTSALEPHTNYFSPRATEEFNINMRLSLEGIGAVLRTDAERTQIIRIVAGGPADQSNVLKAGDYITGVGQGLEDDITDVIGWRLSDVVDKIRGPKGSVVSLQYVSGSGMTEETKIVNIKRDKIKLEEQAAKKEIIELNGNPGDTSAKKIGVIKLPSFYIDFQARSEGDKNYRSTTRDVKKLIRELNAESIDGLVIDLRGNGGGSLDEAIKLTGLFIDTGPVVQVENGHRSTQTHIDRAKGYAYKGPLAVLVDRRSASASEIFAGAIQDYKRGLIIGETTFGKGTVQNILPLSTYAKDKYKDKVGQVKITIAQFFRINGESTQHKGVVPDVAWTFRQSTQEHGERSLKNALPWKAIDPEQFVFYQPELSDSAVDIATSKHSRRSAGNTLFQATVDKLNLITKLAEQDSVTLNINERKAKRDQVNQQFLAIENSIRTANQLPAYKSYKELQYEQELRSKRFDEDEVVYKDAFLIESGHILSDYIQATQDTVQNMTLAPAQ